MGFLEQRKSNQNVHSI